MDEKHYLLNRGNLAQPIQMQLYQKQKNFSDFFCCFYTLYEILNNFEKKIILIADVFPQLRGPKNVVT